MSIYGDWQSASDVYTLTRPPRDAKTPWTLPGGLLVRGVTWSTGEESTPQMCKLLSSNGTSESIDEVIADDVRSVRAYDKALTEYFFNQRSPNEVLLLKTPDGQSPRETMLVRA
ncbi:hypothetical protein DIPPA_20865 [Diplonema papillatum]|nr:hypothetical protein DIPPA_20865 [Diplonema papillatum]